METVLRTLKKSGTIPLKALGYYITRVGRPGNRDPLYAPPTVSWNKTAYYLRRRGDIRLNYRDHKTWVSLTKQGEKRLDSFALLSLDPPNRATWDGKWRFVMFDIPETHRRLRHLLRLHLKSLHFAYLQKSVWITPYDAKEQIKRLCRVGKLNARSIRFALVDTFDREREFLKFFKIARK